jgi:hypothetical protein
MIFQLGFDTPYWDQWWHTDLIGKSFEGTAVFSDYWRLINEHRVFFPNYIFVGLAKVTNWNIRAELFLIFILSTMSFVALLYKIVSQQKKETALWVIPLISVFWFSFSQHNIFTWGLHVIIAFAALFMVLLINVLSRSNISPVHLVAAICCAGIASLSFGAGVAAWGIGFGMLATNSAIPKPTRVRFLAVWVLSAAGIMAVYFLGYESTPASQSATDVLFHPLRSVGYFLAYLGSPIFPYQAHLSVATGVVGLGVGGLFIKRKVESKKFTDADLFVAGLWMAGLGAAFLTMLKQWPEGIEQALSSRYIIWPTFFWVGVFVEWSRAAAGAEKSRKPLIAVLFTLGIIGCLYGTYRADERHDAFLEGKNALMEGAYDDRILYLYPDKSVVEKFRPVLIKHQLSIFNTNEQ